jgi:hypothetical protein
VALVAGTTEIVLTSFLAEATVARIDVGGAAPEELAVIALEGSAFTLGAAVDAEGRYAFVPQPNDARLSIVDFESGSARSVTWLDGHGPTWVAIGP